jgi:glycosyltransferase involved in cell wall biosynthesis
VIGAGVDPVSDADPTRFRRQHGIEGPYLLYVGRVDVEKGCRGLVEAFLAWRERAPEPVTLVLMGTLALKLPRHPALRVLGFRPEAEKQDALAGATALVMPSPHESFSFVVLEAWSQGTPVLATARSPVLRGHVTRSGAGLLFDQAPDDLGTAVSSLLADAALGKTLGERGRAYVEAQYRWPRITAQYLDFLARVFSNAPA